jgi:hypothetical protein
VKSLGPRAFRSFYNQPEVPGPKKAFSPIFAFAICIRGLHIKLNTKTKTERFPNTDISIRT